MMREFHTFRYRFVEIGTFKKFFKRFLMAIELPPNFSF